MSRYGPDTALVVVDVQNDFADPAGALSVRDAPQILGPLNRAIDEARSAGSLIVYTQDWHPQHTPHFATDGGAWPPHCVQGTWGAEFHPGLRRVEPAVHILKGSSGEDGYSAFTMRDPITGQDKSTGLAETLRERNIHKVVVAGLATDYCVRWTAREALDGGFEVTVLEDAVKPVEVNPGDGAKTIAELRAHGARMDRAMTEHAA